MTSGSQADPCRHAPHRQPLFRHANTPKKHHARQRSSHIEACSATRNPSKGRLPTHAAKLGIAADSETLRRWDWLGLLSAEPLPEVSSIMDVLVERLSEKLAYEPGERDMIALHHEFGAQFPEHSEKTTLFELLDATNATGISLTEHFAMLPAASVSGWYFAHPDSRYFGIGKIGRDQLADYARRLGITEERAETLLRPIL